MSQTTIRQPMEGVRVLDIATFVAAPFCGTILADFGAEVIKIEQPNGGDTLRKFGTPTECGDTLVWLSEARNKQSMTLDLRSPEGAELFKALVAESDVVLENFRPGTLEKWGLGFETLREINPKLVMLRVSAYGQTGPKRGEPGFARIAHAFGGLSFLAGEPDGPPVVPGSTSLADYISGMWGAIGVLLAMRSVEAGGVGQFIDIGLYESVFRLLDEIAPAYAKFGLVRERMGPDTVNVVPHSHYETSDNRWIALACSNDRMFQRLAVTMGQPELAELYPTSPDRVAARAKINALVSLWVSQHTQEELLKVCADGQVPAGPLYSIEEIFQDPQYAERKNLIRIQDPRVGELVLPSAIPRLSETPATFNHAGPALGSSTDEILRRVLSLTAADIASLRANKTI
ncbi:putative acyl-CoA transferase/carnitine dehydratase [Pseudomonas sp. JV551A1]|uniref:CaiB/BaiF CoA transferase family protein n=1 Tax=Pseudomonas sp. JV551A1 TaxID=2078787 RepID=UPI00100C80AD|nr:CoA transferase [Pseudomonas sp. JV551A1]SPO55785.1 putative acyl-CoA transferase/carnitine dehydratase [Pseudomonas sp. JV551A1]